MVLGLRAWESVGNNGESNGKRDGNWDDTGVQSLEVSG